MTMFEPDEEDDKKVGVEFEEFFDLPIIDPEEVMKSQETPDESPSQTSPDLALRDRPAVRRRWPWRVRPSR